MKTYYYLIHIQYLGFRFHGWQKQPGVKTVEGLIEKTVFFVLGHDRFKILGCSRTDAKVSASHSACELFVDNPLDTDQLFAELNLNLPNDIRVIKIEQTDSKFNIIQSPKIKEYLYFFSSGEKAHPFCAPLISSFVETLDIELMKKGAKLFEGEHDFVKYCTKPGPDKKFKRTVLCSEIKRNIILTASFFPEETYVFRIQSKGFIRNQVRLMMGQLLRLGRGETGLKDIEKSLEGTDNKPFWYIAPASGLILNQIQFEGL